ncbi:aspartate-alanine antiporter [Candidatus Dependentiae bacterium]|nr:MAG: aspartate-alanine antiporter [Candidatus Dependentiae bacterium]
MMLHNIFDDIATVCRNYPQILIFLSLAIGYYAGKIEFFGFKLGSTASVLLAAIVLGQMDVEITPLIKSVAFALFIFTIGYKVGPQFFGGLKKDALKYTVLTFFVAIVGLVTTIVLGKFFGFDKGTTAGFLAGAMTQSSIIGTAEDAIKNLSISSAQKAILTSNIAVSYAITYIFGVAGLILFYKIVPKFLKVDLKDEAQKLEAKLSGATATQAAIDDFNKHPSIRIYRVTNKNIEEKKVSDVQILLPKRVIIEKIKRGDNLIEPKPDITIKPNDLIAVIGDREQIIDVKNIIGPEIDDPALMDLPIEIIKICVTKPQVEGKKLGEILKKYGQHCFISKITEQGHELPLKKNMIVYKGNVLHVIGLKKDVESFAKNIGYLERKTHATDLVIVGLGCFLGTLLGLAAIKIGTIPLTLGIGGGILLAGLFFGWLRSLYPTFGQIPNGAQWILTDLGLNLFIACVGLTAGPKAIHALQAHGSTLFFAGVALTLLPHILGLMFGRIVLKLNYILLLGALTGAGTATPSLNVLKNETDSLTPVLGYTVPYAIGNFILTIWGTVIVSLM